MGASLDGSEVRMYQSSLNNQERHLRGLWPFSAEKQRNTKILGRKTVILEFFETQIVVKR